MYSHSRISHVVLTIVKLIPPSFTLLLQPSSIIRGKFTVIAELLGGAGEDGKTYNKSVCVGETLISRVDNVNAAVSQLSGWRN